MSNTKIHPQTHWQEELKAKRFFVPEAIVLSIILGWSAAAHSADTAWPVLNKQVTDLSTSGRHAEALPVAQEALDTAEKKFGPSSPETALSLNNLALIYKKQGQYEKAAELYKRALVIGEKVAGKNNPDLLVTFNNLAVTYEAMGKRAEAQKIYDEARLRGHKDWADQAEARAKAARTK